MDGTFVLISDTEEYKYMEYKEPVVHTRYIHWLRNKQTLKIFTAVTDRPNGWDSWLNFSDHLKTTKDEYVER